MYIIFCVIISVFVTSPEDKTLTVNETNVLLHCEILEIPGTTFDELVWEIFLRNGTFWTVTGADEVTQLARLVQCNLPVVENVDLNLFCYETL